MQHSLRLDQQLVLVTGAARGLGEHLVHAFLREGAKVVINYHKSAAAAKTLANEAPEQLLAIQADITDSAAVQAMFAQAREHFGMPVTTVINNALPDFSFNGDARPKVEQLRMADLNQQFTGVVGGALNTTQAALAGMREACFGRIINIGSNLVQNPVVP